MFDHWFPAISPSGRLAVGSQQVTTYNSAQFDKPQPIGPGLRPTWDGETLYYLSPEGYPMFWTGTRSERVISTAFNEFSVANGFWAGHRTDPPRIIWKAGGPTNGWWKPRLSNNGFSALRHADGALCFGNLGNIVDIGVREHCLQNDTLVWVKDTSIYGRQGSTGFTRDLTIPGEKHFYAFPLLIGGQPWVLTHTDDRLLLYPWGSHEGYVLNSGISDNPVAHATGFRVTAVWSANGEGFGHVVHVDTRARVDLRPQGNTEDTSGAVDLWAYFFPKPGAFPRTSDIPGHGHEMHCIFDGRNFWTLPFGEPDHWVRMVRDGDYLIFREDRSRDNQNSGDYSFTNAVWAYRRMAPDDRIRHNDNELVRYNADTCEIIDRHPMPFVTGLWKRWTAFDCGGDLGVKDVIAYLYDPGGDADTYELSYFAKDYGFFRWEEYNQRTHELRHWTVFNEFGGRTPQPTPGCWRAEHNTPPSQDMTDAEVRALFNFAIPPDIYLGALDQFIANLLPRDRIVNAPAEDPNGPLETHTMNRGAQMFFNPLYYQGVIGWIGERKRHPNGAAEWGDASMRGLLNAVTVYNRDIKQGPPVTPPAGDRLLGNITGQAKVALGWWDNTGLIKPTLCHVGDLFSVYVRNPARALEILDFIVAAGYHGIRFWTTLGGDSSFWAGRGISPVETPNYWELLKNFLSAIKERGLVAHIAQGDLRASVVPDRDSFARHLAEYLNIIGPDVCFLFEALNESRDTGEPSAAKLAEFANVFTAHCPWPLVALSAYTGHEDVAITNDFSRDPADIYTVHGYRDGHYWDKIRHIFSWAYESKPQKREGIQGEPFGPGPDVSASQNKHELTSEVMQAAAVMSLMTRQAWVYFSDPGVRTDHGPERLEHMPGFWETPQAVALLPQDITGFHQIVHGGDTWRNQRVFAAQGEIRADHALHADGRFACLIYGPGFGHGRFHVPQTRGADIHVDHYFGDCARLVIGKVH